MNNQIQKTNQQLPLQSQPQQTNREAANIADEAGQDAGFQAMIKFKHGEYYCDDKQVPLLTRMIAHCIGWTKTWVHFENRQVVERHVYRIAKGERAPDREQWGHTDPANWPPGLDGKPADPWVLQYLLPLEMVNSDSGEVRIFVGSSFGARRAVADLCQSYGRRAARVQNCGQPIIKLDKTLMPTKNFGDVPRPYFDIIGWDEPNREPVRQIADDKLKRGDFDDEIPF